MAKYTLNCALGTAKRGSQRHQVLEDAKRILEEHAPEVAAMAKDADWSSATQVRVRSAIGALTSLRPHRDNVGNAISHVIAFGKKAGLWAHKPDRLRLLSPFAPDRIRAKDQERLQQVDADRARFLANIPLILKSRDRAVLQGAILFSAAFIGGLMHKNLLQQLCAPTPLQEYEGLRWFDFALGATGRPEWRNPRRWFPDEVTLAILRKLKDVPRSRDPVAGLKALAEFISTRCYSLEELAGSARLWWSARLPSCLVEYATQLQLAPSVPALVFKRILTAAPLTRAEEDELRLSMPACPQAIGSSTSEPVERRVVPPSSTDGINQELAVDRLMRLLRKQRRGKVPSEHEVLLRLERWNSEFEHLGGWTWLLGEWAAETLRNARGRRRRDRHLGRGGLLRYLEGFAYQWIATMHDLPPEAVEHRQEDLDDRMKALALELGALNSASVSHTGLVAFLTFVRNIGGPDIVLGSEWEDVQSLCEARANLVTPDEFARTRRRMNEVIPSSSLPGMRLQVMALLAYTTGLRWELLHTLRYKDVLFMEDDDAHGVVLRRPNAYAEGKTAPEGGVCLEQVLPLDDRRLVRLYIEEARRVSGASNEHFIFADPQAPHVPPSPVLTRDLIQKVMREVTRDPTLRFHDLRHSAANLMMVSVALPQDDAVITALARLAGFSAAARGITQGSYVQLVTGRSHADRSRLYVVSELLGHSTPATTMRSYLHVVDAIFAEEISRRAGLTREVKAAIRGVSEDAIRKAEYRARRRASRSTLAAKES